MDSVSSTMSGTEVRVVRTKRYRWPAAQLNFWLLIMTVAGCTMLGVYASFLTVQNQMGLGIPWYMPYWISVGSLTVLFVLIMLYLLSNRSLLPGIVMLGSFILFILWLVGLIVISLELWGPSGSVNSNCNLYVNGQVSTGPNTATLAWLQQHSICQSWQAAFSFALVGCVFLLWMMIMAYKVYADD